MSFEDTAPLLHTERITDEKGLPTRYFMKQWDVQRGLNSEISGILDLNIRVDALEIEVDTLNLEVTALQNIDLIAGTGLNGGGDLSGPDRTFNLANTTVTAAAYTNADITIDAQGRITAAANGSGGGGTAEYNTHVGFVEASINGGAQAFKGQKLIPNKNITITNVVGLGTYATTGTYQAVVLEVNSSNVVQAVTASSSTQVPALNSDNREARFFGLNAALIAGKEYILMVGIVSGTDTTAMTLQASNTDDSFNAPGDTESSFFSLAKKAPAATDTVTATASGFRFGIGFTFSM